MFERFTAAARRVVVLAQEEARLLNHNHIGTEHILLGLIHEGDGVAAKSLESLGISLGGVRSRIQEIIDPDPRAPSGHIPFTPTAKKALELSLREALQLGHSYIGTEHLLLGLIAATDGDGVKLLAVLTGLSGERLHRHVLDYLAAHPQPEQSEAGQLTVLTLAGNQVSQIRLTAAQLALIAAAAGRARTSLEVWITERLLAAAHAETSPGN